MQVQVKIITILLLITICLSFQPKFKDCNFTDYRFQSKYNLGQQDELNNTFDLMNKNFSTPNIVYPINSYTNFSFTNINTSFSYIDSKQKAETLGNDTIVIAGGYTQALVDMNWVKKDFLQIGGSLQALCRTDEIIFSKNLTIQRGFLIYQIQQLYDITFKATDCKILRYQPAKTSQSDLKYLAQMLNGRQDQKQTLRTVLAAQINKKYFSYLNVSLYNQKHQLDYNFTYDWINQKKKENISIRYQVLPTGVDLEKQGLSFTFVTEIENWDEWKCGATIPYKNLDVKKYGGVQEFTSLSVFQNTLRYGIQKGALNTILNKANWQSNMFQFFAGDLYEVIPYISTKYIAMQPITGTCKGLNDNVNIVPQQLINQFMVRTGHTCQLFIQNTTKILQLDIDLHSYISAKFQQQAKVNFYLKNFTHSLSYRQQPMFQIQNYDLANAMLHSTLNNLNQVKVFGSGWPTYKMDYPHMKVMGPGYVIFYDSSSLEMNYQQPNRSQSISLKETTSQI